MGLIRNLVFLGFIGAAIWHYTGPHLHSNSYASTNSDAYRYAERHGSSEPRGYGERPSAFAPARPVHLSAGEAIYFAPGDNLERVDIALIQSARSSIRVAMFAFTDRELAAALAEAARRAVKVRVYRDRTQFTEEQQRRAPALQILLSASLIQLRVKQSEELIEYLKSLSSQSVFRPRNPCHLT